MTELPSSIARLTTALMQGFKPGTSPPPVKIPILIFISPLFNLSEKKGAYSPLLWFYDGSREASHEAPPSPTLIVGFIDLARAKYRPIRIICQQKFHSSYPHRRN